MQAVIKKSVLTMTLMLSFITALAYDFKVDGIAYNIVSLSDLTCEVTQSDTKYSGDIVIPSTVIYQGRKIVVVSIGGDAFYDCSNLISVEIPNSVTTIGNSAFYGCWSLTSVEIPNSVTTIGYLAFHGCWSLTSVEIPSSVTKIGEDAFHGCSSLVSVEIPNSVTTIGNSAFYGCSSLTSVEIPNSVTEIGYSAFQGCSSLTSVEIPNSVTKIHDSAFQGCSSLTSVKIPNSVIEIGDNAFDSCPLKSLIWGSNMNIRFKGTNSNSPFEGWSLKYLEILPSVNEVILIYAIGRDDRLPSLKKLSLGRSLGNYRNRYDIVTCPDLTELELTGYVKYFKIEGASFLTNLTIDNGVELTTGEYGADMSKYDKLECITMKGDVPQFIPTFANAAYLNAKLRVPKGTLSAYQNAEGWKNFWNIEAYEVEVDIDEVPVEVGDKTECGRYDLQGRPVDDTYRGVTIIRYTDGSAKKVVTTH